MVDKIFLFLGNIEDFIPLIFREKVQFYRKFTVSMVYNGFFEVQKHPERGNHAIIRGVCRLLTVAENTIFFIMDNSFLFYQTGNQRFDRISVFGKEPQNLFILQCVVSCDEPEQLSPFPLIDFISCFHGYFPSYYNRKFYLRCTYRIRFILGEVHCTYCVSIGCCQRKVYRYKKSTD